MEKLRYYVQKVERKIGNRGRKEREGEKKESERDEGG